VNTLSPSEKAKARVRAVEAALPTPPKDKSKAHARVKAPQPPQPLPATIRSPPERQLAPSEEFKIPKSRFNGGGVQASDGSPDKTEIAGSRLYIRAKQQQSKLAQKQAERPRNCTFAPSFVTSGQSRGSGARPAGEFSGGMAESAKGQERYDALYKNAQDISDKIDNKARKKQLQPPGCTFNPKFETTENARKKYRQDQKEEGKKRFENLYSDAKKIKEKIERIKKAENVKRPNEFSPQITKKAEMVVKRRPGASRSFSSRLYKDENAIQAKVEQLKARKEQIELDGCTFQPKVFTKRGRSSSAPKSRPSWQSSSSQAKDVASRLHNYQATVQAHRATLLEKKEEMLNKITPFKPNLETKQFNEQHVKVVRSQSSLINRLVYAGGSEQKSAKRAALLKEEAKFCTFKPNIPKRRATSAPKARPSWKNDSRNRSNEIYNNHKSQYSDGRTEPPSVVPDFNGEYDEPVFERLYATRHNKEHVALAGKEEAFLNEMKECTFSPKVYHANFKNTDVDKMGKANDSVQNPVWNRLYDDQMAIKNLREEIKAQKELNKCSFQPKTGPKSHLKGFKEHYEEISNIPVHLRLSNREIEEVKAVELMTIKLEIETEGCTFKPDLSKSQSDKVLANSGVHKRDTGGDGGIFGRLYEDARNQRIIMENYKKEHEQRELTDCTFKPQINVDIDSKGEVDSSVITEDVLGDGEKRFERLAVPRHVSHKREALERQRYQEAMLRPGGTGILEDNSDDEEMLLEDLGESEQDEEVVEEEEEEEGDPGEESPEEPRRIPRTRSAEEDIIKSISRANEAAGAADVDQEFENFQREMEEQQ